MNPEILTLRFIVQQLDQAARELSAGDLLQARERLALVTAAIDRVVYPGE